MPRTPEQLKIEESRAESDSELIRKGAELVFDKKTEKQILNPSKDQIKQIHDEMKEEKRQMAKKEREEATLKKIKSLELKNNQVIKIIFKDKYGEQVQGLYYFPGITDDGIENKKLDVSESRVDHHEYGGSIYLNNIKDISIGNADDLAYAEKEKKEFGPFKDGSRIIDVKNITRDVGEPWNILRLIDSKGRIVLTKDKEMKNDDFDKVVSDLRSGLTLDECWYKPKEEEKKAEEIKKFDPRI